MGSTKIINVLKNDRFEDVFNALKKAEAEEVILILPKNSRLAKKEEHFAALASEAQSAQKTISIMTADQTVQGYATKHSFKLLGLGDDENEEDGANDDIKELNEEITEDLGDETPEEPATEEDIEEEIDEKDEEYEKDLEENDTVADLTMARPNSSSMSDIRFPEKPSRITVKKSRENSGKVEIKKEPILEERLGKLETIWLDQDNREQKFFASKKQNLPAQASKDFWRNFNFIKRKKVLPNISLIFIASGIALTMLALYVFLGNAQVLVKPLKEKLNFELPVSVSSAYSKVDTAFNKIPGQYLAYSAEVSKDFTSSGQKEVVRKARGEITVYNNFNSEPQGLTATTRFESSKGLTFRIPRSIIIPGAKLISGKLVPGSISVEVIADKPGAEYNINADHFTIPGFKGTPKHDGFYAQSFQPMTGGIVGLAKVVTEKDFNDAKEQTTKEALSKATANLRSKTNNLKTLEPLFNKITSLKSTAEIDDAADGFAVSATAEAKTIGFLDDDLFKLIDAFVNKNGNLETLRSSLDVSYKNVQTDFEKKTTTLTVVVKGDAAQKIDQDKLVNNLLGMSQSEIKDYLLGIKEIESAKVILSPFWVKSIPKDKQDVQVKIVY